MLFRSAARVYGSGVLAVVLTGMGSDGLGGSRVIREQGGSVLAQDEPSSTVWGMPGAVASLASPTASSPLMPSLLKSCASPPARARTSAHILTTGGVLMEQAAATDYGYLRQLVFSLSQNVLDPSRDYLFDTRLSKLLRNQGMTHLNELVRHLRTRKDPSSSSQSPRP